MMARLRRLGMACLIVVCATAAADAAQLVQSDYRIGGVVVDAGTGAPVAHADVFIGAAGEESQTTTGGDGRFVFRGLAAAKYALSVTARGYVREGFQQHGAYTTGIAVGSGLDSEHLVFRLHRQAVITGKVTDEHGEAVRRAEVMLFSVEKWSGKRAPSELTRVMTDDRGEYRISHLQAGKYYVAASAQPWYAQMELSDVPGLVQDGSSSGSERKSDPLLDVVYPITFYPSVTNDRAAGELDLSAGETKTADIQVQAVPAVHVHLTNLPTSEGGQTTIEVRQMFFGAVDERLNSVSGQITPGKYEVAALPPGEVTLIVSESGSEGASSRTIRTNVQGGETLDTAAKGATARVTGRAIFPAENENSERGQVSLQSESGQNVSVPLEKDGTFSFTGVLADAYEVLVGSPEGNERVEKISATGATTHGRKITIAGAGDVQLNIMMGEASGQVTGVAKLDGKSIAGVMVLLVPESGENLEEDSRLDQSDSDGTFALGDILPGKYRIVAIEDGWELERTNWGILKPYVEKGQSLQISANEQKKVVVEVQHKK